MAHHVLITFKSRRVSLLITPVISLFVEFSFQRNRSSSRINQQLPHNRTIRTQSTRNSSIAVCSSSFFSFHFSSTSSPIYLFLVSSLDQSSRLQYILISFIGVHWIFFCVVIEYSALGAGKNKIEWMNEWMNEKLEQMESLPCVRFRHFERYSFKKLLRTSVRSYFLNWCI